MLGTWGRIENEAKKFGLKNRDRGESSRFILYPNNHPKNASQYAGIIYDGKPSPNVSTEVTLCCSQCKAEKVTVIKHSAGVQVQPVQGYTCANCLPKPIRGSSIKRYRKHAKWFAVEVDTRPLDAFLADCGLSMPEFPLTSETISSHLALD